MSLNSNKLVRNEPIVQKVISAHKSRFGAPPQAAAYAPGRVEILGNHTDYNEGYVLSAAIDSGICAAVSPAAGKECVVAALDAGGEATFDLALARKVQKPFWANYIIGTAVKMGSLFPLKHGFNLTFAGDVPQGAGLSSSAALEVAVALALAELFKDTYGKSENGRARRPWPTPPKQSLWLRRLDRAVKCKSGSPGGFALPVGNRNSCQQSNLTFDLMQIAKFCQQAENEFTGARCGLLDQISSLFGAEHALIFTDFRSLAVETVPLKADICFLLANTRVKHSLVESAYNERRAACEKAAEYFAGVLDHPVRALRDVTAQELEKYSQGLDPVIARRARHICGENERVLEARKLLAAGKMKEFGRLMFASHESSRVNFENSCPELDFIVESVARVPEVLGARLSGGGFGGSVVMLVSPEDADKVAGIVSSAYAGRFGASCEALVIRPSAGARVLGYSEAQSGIQLRQGYAGQEGT